MRTSKYYGDAPRTRQGIDAQSPRREQHGKASGDRTKRQPDILHVAFKALAIAPAHALSSKARAVAGAILAHWNRKSRQCDPSVERLATMLGIDRATVLRAITPLCAGENRLFDKAKHGGKMGRSSYAPRWEAFQAIVEDWEARMQTGDAPRGVANVRRLRSQIRDVGGSKSATQTHRKNSLKEPQAVSLSMSPIASTGLTASTMPSRRQLPSSEVSMTEAAKNAAERRINTALLALGTEIYRLAMSDVSDDVYTEAVAAEVKRPSCGAPIMVAAVRRLHR